MSATHSAGVTICPFCMVTVLLLLVLGLNSVRLIWATGEPNCPLVTGEAVLVPLIVIVPPPAMVPRAPLLLATGNAGETVNDPGDICACTSLVEVELKLASLL